MLVYLDLSGNAVESVPVMLRDKEGEAFFDALIPLHTGALVEGIGTLNKSTLFLYMILF